MEPTAIAIIVGGVLAQIATIITLVLNRRWEVEDRKELAMKVVGTSAELAVKVLATGDALTEHVTEQVAGLSAAVKQAKTAADNSYTEANHVNIKIEAVQKEIKDLNERLVELLLHLKPKPH